MTVSWLFVVSVEAVYVDGVVVAGVVVAGVVVVGVVVVFCAGATGSVDAGATG